MCVGGTAETCTLLLLLLLATTNYMSCVHMYVYTLVMATDDHKEPQPHSGLLRATSTHVM